MSQEENLSLSINLPTPMSNIISGMKMTFKQQETTKRKGICQCGRETPSPAEACCVEHAGYEKFPDLDIIKYKIENYRQNYPELVIQDAKNYLNLNDEQCEILRNVLLARGINKWLAVRKDLVTYKTTIKKEITKLCNELHNVRMELRNYPKMTRGEMSHEEFKKWRNIGKKRVEMKYRLKCLNEVQKELNKMCHSPRYVIWKGKEVVEVKKSGITGRPCKDCGGRTPDRKKRCEICKEMVEKKYRASCGYETQLNFKSKNTKGMVI